MLEVNQFWNSTSAATMFDEVVALDLAMSHTLWANWLCHCQQATWFLGAGAQQSISWIPGLGFAECRWGPKIQANTKNQCFADFPHCVSGGLGPRALRSQVGRKLGASCCWISQGSRRTYLLLGLKKGSGSQCSKPKECSSIWGQASKVCNLKHKSTTP